MIRSQTFKALGLSVMAVLTLAQCGKDNSRTNKVTVEILPKKPIVITADVTVDGTTYTAPWFSFRASMKNDADEQFTIVAVEAEVTAVDDTGQITTKTVAWSASSFNFTYSDTIECQYSDFGTWTVGEDEYFRLDNGVPQCQFQPVFIVASNTKNSTGNFRYTVKFKPLGWFGPLLDPQDRFEKTKTFYTQ